MDKDEKYMKLALKEAQKARDKKEVPVGAVLVLNDKVIARAHNLKTSKHLATAHAEILAIEKANKKIQDWRLDGMELYVTLEPCPMCAGAIQQSRIKRVIFGAYDPKGGSVVSCMKMYETKGYNHYPEVTGGILQQECSEILSDFFRQMRKENQKKT